MKVQIFDLDKEKRVYEFLYNNTFGIAMTTNDKVAYPAGKQGVITILLGTAVVYVLIK